MGEIGAANYAAGEEAAATREKHLRRVADLTGAAEDTVVVFGDLNVRDAELAELTRRPLGAFPEAEPGAGSLGGKEGPDGAGGMHVVDVQHLWGWALSRRLKWRP